MIAIADAFSDALGIHVSEESENTHSEVEIWESTVATFLTKFTFAVSFIAPILLFSLSTAILISVIWGLSLLGLFSFYLAKKQGLKPWRVISEHIIIALIVVAITHYIGDFIGAKFG
jgi:VIT1/CCC1 family predicted Fe2+/Mn2+ transporter